MFFLCRDSNRGSFNSETVTIPTTLSGFVIVVIRLLLIFSTHALQPSRLIARSGLDVPTFANRRLHACHHARAPSGGRWKCGREMSRKFCLNVYFHDTFRNLLHAVKLQHGTDGFTSPNEGVLRIFSP
jgi:hypothetical protein